MVERPTVLLFGWGGAQPRQLERYRRLYDELGIDSEVYLFDTSAALVRPRQEIEKLGRWWQQLPANVATQPFGVHLFSNTGMFALGALAQHWQQQFSESIRIGLKFVLFDSSPGMASDSIVGFAAEMYRGYGAVVKGSLPNWAGNFADALLGTGFVTYSVLCPDARGRLAGLRHRCAQLPPKVAFGFVYSDADAVVQSKDVEAFMQEAKDGHRVTDALRCKGSGHVQHYRKHPDQYRAFVARFAAQLTGAAD